ncbi:hypothetical protein [Streptosporangium roseum]|uniref:Secreted protein n=1 Tax=Streptosporangium roseum (strain ATCC 12428 / DSM 43021 / JCM 3005 / KCTC 9067 / NCIMB 10171 / NRRL 2505 / NI 9100) TaxID=479432 RepID=D2B2E8_STRRD|nr:hypothetical protein [Streptosporangium roseum]ACZ91174.1 hypothetical protein Sros_8532 [Streptosporangium roseum DSM 43021]
MSILASRATRMNSAARTALAGAGAAHTPSAVPLAWVNARPWPGWTPGGVCGVPDPALTPSSCGTASTTEPAGFVGAPKK